MQRKSSFTGLVIAALCGLVSGQHREYVFVALPASWHDAQRHCREHHTDLAVFTNQGEAEQANRLTRGPQSWIGLSRDPNNATLWNWSGGKRSMFTCWSPGEPNNMRGREDCGTVNANGHWNDLPCSVEIHFICYNEPELLLVKENKTWEEALEHCRGQGRDLPSLPSDTDHSQAHSIISEAQTRQVWTGLRFLAGEWLWVNGDELKDKAVCERQLRFCPAPDRRCGTLAKRGGLWRAWDCQDRLNFLCSKKKVP